MFYFLFTFTTLYIIFKKCAKDEYLDPASEEFSSIRELAKRFSTAFGPDPVRSREAIAVIHRYYLLINLILSLVFIHCYI